MGSITKAELNRQPYTIEVKKCNLCPTCKEAAVLNFYKLKTEIKIFSFVFLGLWLPILWDVGWERRTVLRFISMSVLWRTCSDSRFINFPSSIQIKKRQQDVVRFLEANRIEFEEVDITMSEEKRQWMYKNIPEDRQPAQGNPLPPQIFSDDRYCGVSGFYGSQWTRY